jgi:crossover junction endodeoxyribonuclease RusA
LMTGRCVANSYRIEYPPKTKLITSNGREHWRTRAKITRELRALAKEVAKEGEIPRMERVHVLGILHYPDNRRRDPGNWYPSVKAMIDGGLVDSKILADDSDRYVVFDGIHRGDPNIKGGQLILEITEAEDELWNHSID